MCQNSYKTFRNIQWWYLYWMMILNSFSFIGVNHFVNDCTTFNFLPLFLLHRSSREVRVQLLHLGLITSTLDITLTNIHRDVLVLMSTLEIALANIVRDVFVLLDVADVLLCSKVDFLFLLFRGPSVWPPFIPFALSPLHLDSALLGMKDLLFILLGFPRHASLRDRSPESYEPYETLDSRSSLDQNHIRSSYFFLS